MSVIDKVGEFLNTLTMQYELLYKWWINAVVMILSGPHCLCWSFYFQNMITFLFEKLSCAVEILIWSDAVDLLIKLLGMPYSVVTAQQACSTEMVKLKSDLSPIETSGYWHNCYGCIDVFWEICDWKVALLSLLLLPWCYGGARQTRIDS